MATSEKAIIGVEVKKKKNTHIEYIEVDADGDIHATGRRLCYYWEGYRKAKSLVDMGNHVLVMNEAGESHTIGKHFTNKMMHYEWNLIKERDLKLKDQSKSKTTKNEKKWLATYKVSPVKWVYLFKNKQWYYAKVGHNSAFKKMNKEDFQGSVSKFASLEDDKPIKMFDWSKYAEKNTN